MGDANDATGSQRDGERDASSGRRGERSRGGQGQGCGKRLRSAPGAGGGRPKYAPRALPARKWMMYAPPSRADANAPPVAASTFRVVSFNVLAGSFVPGLANCSGLHGSADQVTCAMVGEQTTLCNATASRTTPSARRNTSAWVL